MDPNKMREEAAALASIIAKRHVDRAAAAICKHDLPEDVVELLLNMSYVIDSVSKQYVHCVNGVIDLVEANGQMVAENENLKKHIAQQQELLNNAEAFINELRSTKD